MIKHFRLFSILVLICFIALAYQNCGDINVIALNQNSETPEENPIDPRETAQHDYYLFNYNTYFFSSGGQEQRIQLSVSNPQTNQTQFEKAIPLPFSNLDPYIIYRGFYDEDGYEDIGLVFTRDVSNYQYELQVFSGFDGSVLLTIQLDRRLPLYMADFDRDGNLDVLVHRYNSADQTQLYQLNKSTSNLTEILSVDRIGYDHYPLGDINNDGVLDYFMRGYSASFEPTRTAFNYILNLVNLEPVFQYDEIFSGSDITHSNDMLFYNNKLFITTSTGLRTISSVTQSNESFTNTPYPAQYTRYVQDLAFSKSRIQSNRNYAPTNKIFVALLTPDNADFPSIPPTSYQFFEFDTQTAQFDSTLPQRISTITNCSNCTVYDAEFYMSNNEQHIVFKRSTSTFGQIILYDINLTQSEITFQQTYQENVNGGSGFTLLRKVRP